MSTKMFEAGAVSPQNVVPMLLLQSGQIALNTPMITWHAQTFLTSEKVYVDVHSDWLVCTRNTIMRSMRFEYKKTVFNRFYGIAVFHYGWTIVRVNVQNSA